MDSEFLNDFYLMNFLEIFITIITILLSAILAFLFNYSLQRKLIHQNNRQLAFNFLFDNINDVVNSAMKYETDPKQNGELLLVQITKLELCFKELSNKYNINSHQEFDGFIDVVENRNASERAEAIGLLNSSLWRCY